MVEEKVTSDKHGDVAELSPHFHECGEQTYYGNDPGAEYHSGNVSFGIETFVAVGIEDQLVTVVGDQCDGDDDRTWRDNNISFSIFSDRDRI